jgi:hypothetical protein
MSLMLARYPAFSELYEVIFHPLGLEGEALEASLSDFANADLIFIERLRSWRRHPMAGRLPASAKVAYRRTLSAYATWPFEGEVEYHDANFVYGQPLFYPDWAMALLRARGVPVADRVAVYKALDWSGALTPDDFRRAAAFDERQWQADDKAENSRLGRYITDHWRSRQLFHSYSHPTLELFVEMIAEALEKVGLPDSAVRQALTSEIEVQVPLHPSVAQVLELAWAPPEKIYYPRHGEPMTFDDYFALYAQAYG